MVDRQQINISYQSMCGSVETSHIPFRSVGVSVIDHVILSGPPRCKQTTHTRTYTHAHTDTHTEVTV